MTHIQTPYGNLFPSADTHIPVNLSVAEIQDLSKRKGGYTKTIQIAGTKDSNKIFSHYYDVNLADATFNHKEKMPVILIQDGIEVLKGYLRLLKVNIEANTTETTEQYITYEVSVSDTTSSFYQDLGTKKLSDLDFTEYDHIRTVQNIVNGFYNDYTDGYKYVLPYTDDSQYNLNEFTPALFIRTYFDSIFASAGYSYQWDEKDSNKYNFSKLIMPYTGKYTGLTPQKDVEAKVEGVNLNKSEVPSSIGVPTGYSPSNIIMPTVTQDDGSNYDPVYGIFTLPIDQNAFNFVVTYDIEYELVLNNQSGGIAFLRNTGTPRDPLLEYKVKFGLYRDIGSGDNLTYNATPVDSVDLQLYKFLNTGQNRIIQNTVSGQFQLSMFNYYAGDEFNIKSELEANAAPLSTPIWADSASGAVNPVNVYAEVKIKSIKVSFIPTADSYGNGQTMEVSKFVDDKTKQRDFIKSFLNMFNLYIEVDPDQPTKIIIKGRDEYYDSGSEHDWSKKMDLSKPQNLTFTAESINKEFNLKYKTGTGLVNTGYTDASGQEYGSLQYTYSDQFLSGESSVETIWEPSPIIKSTFSAYINSFDTLTTKDGLRILYADTAQRQCSNYRINTSPIDSLLLTEYSYSGHFDNPVIPSFDLNFGVCPYYFYTPNVLTNNNLYNLHWSRTIQQLENARILEAYFDLGPNDINQIKLNDRVWAKGTWWNILEIKDYNANGNQSTKVKLITVDANQDFDEFFVNNYIPPYKPGFNGSPGVTIGGITHIDRDDLENLTPNRINPGNGKVSAIFTNMARDRIPFLNNIESMKANLVIGRNNNLGPSSHKSVVIGDNNEVEGSDNFVLGNNHKVTGNDLVIINNVVLNKVIELTRTELIALRDNQELVPSQLYKITDKDIILIATEIDQISEHGKLKRTGASATYYQISGINKGVFNINTIPTVAIGDIYVWGAKVWEATAAGTPASPTNEVTLDPLFFTELTDSSYYSSAWFDCIFNIDNDLVITIIDNRNNTFTFTAGLYNTIIDWFDVNIFDNTAIKILNNRISAGIYRNTTYRSIYNNSTTGAIYENSNAGDIYNNYNTGVIQNNSNAGDIYNNYNTGVIQNNSNAGSIYNNYNTGVIQNNSNAGGIEANFNSGGIYGNSNTGAILNNSNDGNINVNSNTGNIQSNSNDGNININSNSSRIYNNNNTGNINLNSNLGAIDDNKSNVIDILSNSNKGAIISNTNTGDIYNNSNLGDISVNSNIGNIYNNSNNGSIRDNSNNGSIRDNSNLGYIQLNSTSGAFVNNNIEHNACSNSIESNVFGASNIHINYNVNNGIIGFATRTTTIEDPIVNK